MKMKPLFGRFKEERFEDLSSDYLTKQIINLNGRKNKQLSFINESVVKVKEVIGKKKLDVLDGFSGSGIVSRLFKHHSNILYANDLENFSTVLNQCYLRNREEVDKVHLQQLVDNLNETAMGGNVRGFIEDIYSPKNDIKIKKGERAVFTNENAKIIDSIRQNIDKLATDDEKPFLIAPLIVAVSKRSNVPGVYRAFYTDSTTGLGSFHIGAGNYKRVSKRISLELPEFSSFSCQARIFNQDINELIKNLPEVDLAYFDPPFDVYSYGEDYFMYNTVAKYERPTEITLVAGVPLNWNRSMYNSSTKALKALTELLENTRAKYILLSYNSKGIIPKNVLVEVCKRYGTVSVVENSKTVFDYLISIKVK